MPILDLIAEDSEHSGKSNTFLNHHSYLVHKRRGTKLERFDSIRVDGIAMVWLLRLFGASVSRRSFDYTSIADEVFRAAELEGSAVFVVGSLPAHVESFVFKLAEKYPRIMIIGAESGHFSTDLARDNCISKIVCLRPDLLIVGMGAPLQEQFLIDVMDRGWCGTSYTCGGFIHQTAEKGAEYYPAIFNALNLRWLYRILDEPRLWRRYLLHYPIATLYMAMEAISLRVRDSGRRARN